jgi:hypothetical protein
MMARRWYITAGVLGGFLMIIGGIFVAVSNNATMAGEWKELLMLLLGAFIGSYGKIIDYWFSDTDKDKMLVQKMDEEDGVSMGSVNDIKESNKPFTPIIPDAFVAAAGRASEQVKVDHQVEAEANKVAEQHHHEIELKKLEFEHQEHRQCQHVFADVDHNSGNITAQTISKVITSKTKAIIAVNLFGHPAKLHELRKLADEKGIFLIEDNAQGPRASEMGVYAGTVGAPLSIREQ